jgi:hypothetical protein
VLVSTTEEAIASAGRTVAEHAYAAGMFDGEGCILIVSYIDKSSMPNKRRYNLRVNVSQKATEVLYWLQTRWDGYVGENHAASQWVTSGAKARKFLEDVRPFLMVKREQVEYILNREAPYTEEDKNALVAIRRGTKC